MIFVFPEIPHAYGPGPGEIWSEFYVVFDGPVFDLWRRHGLLAQQRSICHLPNIRRWLPQLESVVDRRFPETSEGMVRRVCRLQKFLGDIAESPQRSLPALVPWLDSAMHQLVERPDLPLPAIAKELHLSYETFRKEFSRQTGHSPARYRLHRLIDQALALISQRGLSNNQVAETLGFYDEFHFSRRFKLITGQSTREFRKRLR